MSMVDTSHIVLLFNHPRPPQYPFIPAQNMKRLAIPLFQLYDNAARYASQLSAIPHPLSKSVYRPSLSLTLTLFHNVKSQLIISSLHRRTSPIKCPVYPFCGCGCLQCCHFGQSNIEYVACHVRAGSYNTLWRVYQIQISINCPYQEGNYAPHIQLNEYSSGLGHRTPKCRQV